jgi:hypothetical protein
MYLDQSEGETFNLKRKEVVSLNETTSLKCISVLFQSKLATLVKP